MVRSGEALSGGEGLQPAASAGASPPGACFALGCTGAGRRRQVETAAGLSGCGGGGVALFDRDPSALPPEWDHGGRAPLDHCRTVGQPGNDSLGHPGPAVEGCLGPVRLGSGPSLRRRSSARAGRRRGLGRVRPGDEDLQPIGGRGASGGCCPRVPGGLGEALLRLVEGDPFPGRGRSCRRPRITRSWSGSAVGRGASRPRSPGQRPSALLVPRIRRQPAPGRLLACPGWRAGLGSDPPSARKPAMVCSRGGTGMVGRRIGGSRESHGGSLATRQRPGLGALGPRDRFGSTGPGAGPRVVGLGRIPARRGDPPRERTPSS